jgi:hypothetical protein
MTIIWKEQNVAPETGPKIGFIYKKTDYFWSHFKCYVFFSIKIDCKILEQTITIKLAMLRFIKIVGLWIEKAKLFLILQPSFFMEITKYFP